MDIVAEHHNLERSSGERHSGNEGGHWHNGRAAGECVGDAAEGWGTVARKMVSKSGKTFPQKTT